MAKINVLDGYESVRESLNPVVKRNKDSLRKIYMEMEGRADLCEASLKRKPTDLELKTAFQGAGKGHQLCCLVELYLSSNGYSFSKLLKGDIENDRIEDKSNYPRISDLVCGVRESLEEEEPLYFGARFRPVLFTVEGVYKLPEEAMETLRLLMNSIEGINEKAKEDPETLRQILNYISTPHISEVTETPETNLRLFSTGALTQLVLNDKEDLSELKESMENFTYRGLNEKEIEEFERLFSSQQ